MRYIKMMRKAKKRNKRKMALEKADRARYEEYFVTKGNPINTLYGELKAKGYYHENKLNVLQFLHDQKYNVTWFFPNPRGQFNANCNAYVKYRVDKNLDGLNTNKEIGLNVNNTLEDFNFYGMHEHAHIFWEYEIFNKNEYHEGDYVYQRCNKKAEPYAEDVMDYISAMFMAPKEEVLKYLKRLYHESQSMNKEEIISKFVDEFGISQRCAEKRYDELELDAAWHSVKTA
jgi:hypothetical protein